MEREEKGFCEACGGTGEIVIPAEQRGGEIVDEERYNCECVAKVEFEE